MVKKERRYASTIPYDFMAWRLLCTKDSFTFTFMPTKSLICVN